MNESARYLKVVYWSDEDDCFVGAAPGLFYGGCHGSDERAVYEELLGMVDEVIADYRKSGDPLPPPTAGRIDDLLSGARTAAE
jgi:predicted RNase H-like HicB family nuclease